MGVQAGETDSGPCGEYENGGSLGFNISVRVTCMYQTVTHRLASRFESGLKDTDHGEVATGNHQFPAQHINMSPVTRVDAEGGEGYGIDQGQHGIGGEHALSPISSPR